MGIARKVGATLLIAAALGIWFGMSPDTGEYDRQISAALSEAQLNELTAESAPQQQVVNGWVTRDLLEIIARQQAGSDARQAALTTLLIVTIGIALITYRRERPAPPIVAGSAVPPLQPGPSVTPTTVLPAQPAHD